MSVDFESHGIGSPEVNRLAAAAQPVTNVADDSRLIGQYSSKGRYTVLWVVGWKRGNMEGGMEDKIR